MEVLVPEEQETVKASILLVNNSNRTQTISLSLLGKQYRVRVATNWGRTLRQEDDVQVPAIVMAEPITPQDVQLRKSENVAVFEAKLTKAVEKVLS